MLIRLVVLNVHNVKNIFIFNYNSQVLTQIEKYDNLVVPVIDSLRYMSALAFDVLACEYSIKINIHLQY